jgi:hypothetical protein
MSNELEEKRWDSATMLEDCPEPLYYEDDHYYYYDDLIMHLWDIYEEGQEIKDVRVYGTKETDLPKPHIVDWISESWEDYLPENYNLEFPQELKEKITSLESEIIAYSKKLGFLEIDYSKKYLITAEQLKKEFEELDI